MEYNMSEIAMACVGSEKGVASWKQMGGKVRREV